MIKLHLGSGKRDFGPSWMHIDGGDFPHLVGHDVTKLPYSDNSVDLIYASHLIAYFDRQEIVPIFQEWFRVLKPGGILRLATPDFNTMACLYCDGYLKLDQILGPMYGRMPMGEQTIYHKTVYDLPGLMKLLKDVGFSMCYKYDWRDTEHSHIDDHSSAHVPHDPDAIEKRTFGHHKLISLNMEAVK